MGKGNKKSRSRSDEKKKKHKDKKKKQSSSRSRSRDRNRVKTSGFSSTAPVNNERKSAWGMADPNKNTSSNFTTSATPQQA